MFSWWNRISHRITHVAFFLSLFFSENVFFKTGEVLQNHLLTSIFDLLFCLWYLTTGKPCLWRYWKWSFWRSCHFYLWNSYNNYLILSFMTMSIVYRSCCLSLTHLISYVLAWYYRYWRQAATQFSLFKCSQFSSKLSWVAA